jgi:glucose uptake protein GlcU
MSQFLLIGMACTCAGALCAFAGDLRQQVTWGLGGFLILNLLIWGRLFVQILSTQDLDVVAAQFLLSQAMATCSYLGMVYFLDRAPLTGGAVTLTSRD